MNNKLIGKYLFEKRKSINLTQNELANELGVTYQAVSRWENGDSVPDIDTLSNLADFYNVSIDDILQRKSKMNNYTVTEPDKGSKYENYIQLIFFIFLIGNLIGMGSFIGLNVLATNFKDGDYAQIFIIVAIICSSVFIFGSHFLLNIYFYTITNKTSYDVKWYIRSYRSIVIIILFSSLIVLSSFTSIVILLVVLLRLYEFWIENKYLNIDTNILIRQMPKKLVHKIGVSLSIIAIFYSLLYPFTIESRITIIGIPILYLSYLSLK